MRLLKFALIFLIIGSSAILEGCRGCSTNLVPCANPGSGGNSSSGSNSNSNSGSGSFAIGGTVTGLAANSNGVTLQDNATDTLTITSNGSFQFKTAVAKGQPYAVFVTSPPSSPTQTCTVVNGSGTASNTVSNIQVTCSSGTNSIGGTVVGLSGVGLVLQDNGGDNLSIAVSGAFTFKTALPVGSNYVVTVATQPTSPTQTCTVTNGTGTTAGNVGNIQITCSIGTLSIGGTVSGLAAEGSGVVLQDNGGDNLTIRANGAFTFPTLLSSGATYNATILTQPAGPNQVCTVTLGSGTATASVSNIQVVCPAVFHTIGGSVVGVVGTTNAMILQNNLGDNLTVTGNGTFTFNTPIADGSTYDVSVLVGPTVAGNVGPVRWNYQGTATSNVTDVLIDGGHNDWAWFDGVSSNNQEESLATPPTPGSNTFDTASPGGRKYPATWTDFNGNLWMFGGYGYEVPALTPKDPAPGQPFPLNDMWEYTGTKNYTGSFLNYWNNLFDDGNTSGPAERYGAVAWTQPGATGKLFLFGGTDDFGIFYNDIWAFDTNAKTWAQVGNPPNSIDQIGVYGTQNVASAGNIPGSRFGAASKIDASGTVWLFGGFGYDSAGTLGLLNDLWKYNITTGQWTWVAGSKTANATGSYGTLGTPNGAQNFPGARQEAAAWIDGSGNFWLFGGFDLDSKGNPDALNDLWEFSSGVWTWKSGANVVNQKAVYGTVGVTAATNVPGARWDAGAWTDHNGNLWLFGGEGFDSTGNGSLGDLWEFVGGQWIWQKGPSSVSQSGNYGITPGPIIFPHVINYPGSRFAPAFWLAPFDQSGLNNAFWIFGGEGFDQSSGNGNGLLSDLWRYLPYP